MTKSKGKRASEIRMIPIEKINILNPRVRNQKVFMEIATNMTQVGMKRPITVTPKRRSRYRGPRPFKRRDRGRSRLPPETTWGQAWSKRGGGNGGEPACSPPGLVFSCQKERK